MDTVISIAAASNLSPLGRNQRTLDLDNGPRHAHFNQHNLIITLAESMFNRIRQKLLRASFVLHFGGGVIDSESLRKGGGFEPNRVTATVAGWISLMVAAGRRETGLRHPGIFKRL